MPQPVFELAFPGGILPVFGYGIALGVGLLCASSLALRIGCATTNWNRAFLSQAFFMTAAASIAGAQAVGALGLGTTNCREGFYLSFLVQGTAAVLAGVLASILFFRGNREKFTSWMYILTVPLACLLAFECIGRNALLLSTWGVVLASLTAVAWAQLKRHPGAEARGIELLRPGIFLLMGTFASRALF